MNITVIPLASSIVSVVFAVTVLDQFFARRKPYQLIWAIGLFMYFISFELLGIIIIFTGFLRSREVFGLYRFPLIHGFGKVSVN